MFVSLFLQMAKLSCLKTSGTQLFLEARIRRHSQISSRYYQLSTEQANKANLGVEVILRLS